VIQHPLGSHASASVSVTSKSEDGLLGLVPHTIRGSLHNYEQVMKLTD
jgi:hypothetical protein